MSDNEEYSYSSQWNKILSAKENPKDGEKLVFVKDFPLCLPSERWEEMRKQLKDVSHHVFLTRHPRKTIKSMMAQVDSDANPDWTHFSSSEAGYEDIDKFYNFINEDIMETNSERKTKVTIIDSDEFANNPEAGVQLLCERTGTTFDHSMLKWSPSKLLDTNWKRWSPFYERVQNAVGFETPTGKGATDHTKPLPADLEEEVSLAVPSYKRLFKIRNVIAPPTAKEDA